MKKTKRLCAPAGDEDAQSKFVKWKGSEAAAGALACGPELLQCPSGRSWLEDKWSYKAPSFFLGKGQELTSFCWVDHTKADSQYGSRPRLGPGSCSGRYCASPVYCAVFDRPLVDQTAANTSRGHQIQVAGSLTPRQNK